MSGEPIVPGKGDPAAEADIALDSAKVSSFKQASIPRIKAFLDSLYVSCRREPMEIFRVLSGMLGGEIQVREDYNAQIPYVALEYGTFTLHVLHDLPETDRAEYRAIIKEVIKPELVTLAKELDRAAQDLLLEEARKGLEGLNAARQSLRGTEFEPIDERLLAGAGASSDVVTTRKNSANKVRTLLDGVFKQ